MPDHRRRVQAMAAYGLGAGGILGGIASGAKRGPRALLFPAGAVGGAAAGMFAGRKIYGRPAPQFRWGANRRDK